MKPGRQSHVFARFRFFTWLLVAVWTACIAASLLWNLRQQSDHSLQMARRKARITFENDVLYRRWSAKQGGVYVRVSEDTPPNPYLQVPDRDVTTTSGLSLTLVNPAYMARQVYDLADATGGSRVHLTSLKPLRPENVPDAWEAAALRSFEQGVPDVGSLEQMVDGEYLRLMRPFVTEPSCLKCHAAQGYKEGDIRGGISVSIPMASLRAMEKSMGVHLAQAHVGLWLVGLAGIAIFRRSVGQEILAREQARAGLQREVTERQRAEEVARQRLREIEDLYRNAPVGLCVLDRELRWVRINERLAEINGLPAAAHLGQRVRDVLPELAEAVEPPMRRVLETGQPRLNIEIVSQTPAQPGVQRSWLEQWLPVTDAQGQVTGLSVVVEETTDRKWAEEEIRMLSEFPEQNPNPVLRIARDGVILYANAASAPLLTAWSVRRGEPVPADWHDRVAAALASGEIKETEAAYDARVYSCVLTPIGDQGYVNLYATDVTDRKQAEMALQQLNAELEERVAERTAELAQANAYNRSLIEAAVDPLVTIGPDGKITDVNAATEAATGQTRKELIGADFCDYFTQPEEARAGYQQVFREGFVRDYPLEIRHREGGTTPVLYNASVYRDETGQVIGVFAAARDITERRRAEQRLTAERQRLYDLLETLPVYVVLLSTDYRVPFANRFFRERFGESRGRCCFEYLFQRQEPCENCDTYKVLSTHAPGRWEWTGPDGRDYDIYDFPFTETDGSTLILEMGIDITERKKAQRALEASEARYRSFVTASTQLSWTTDAQGVVAEDMPSWRAFTGQSFEQTQGWGWADAVHPDDRQRTAAIWSQAVATRSLYAVEYRLRRHDGQYRWLSVRGVPVLAGETVREWVGACTDITERKMAEEETRRMREELGHVDRVARLGELTASLAHELNQPLAAILSNAQAARRFLASSSPDLDQFREILDDIIQDDKRAGSVIHRLRLMLQKGQQEPEIFQVNDAIREVIQLLHSEAVGRNATLATDLAAGLPAVRAGRVEVQQVMVNLLLNALDAVQGLSTDRREILVQARLDQDAVVVAVRDRGCGLPSPDCNSIFEPFFTTKPTGLGMGLAICRRMIETHGGRIWAANNEDAGATVVFSLPSTQADQEHSDG